MEELRQEKLIKTIKPKFSFIYELGMPTGKKIKSSLFSLVLFIFLLIMIFFNTDFLYQYSYNVTENMNVVDALKILCIILVVFTGVKLAIHIILQKKQYENISYKFYETYMVYEDIFLNQHKKNILYSNVKEVEIRRTIWDRITGYGVVIIYTNAENKRNNGLVVYALKNPDKFYEFIDGVINRYKVNHVENRDENVDNTDINNKKI